MERRVTSRVRGALLPLLLGMVMMWEAACESDGGGGGGGGNIGDNNPDVYVAMGDSITSGREAPAGAPYPDRLAGIVGRTVVNAGTGGAVSANGVGSVGGLLQRYKPARILVLYGSNDVGAGVSADQFENNIRAIVGAAKVNQTIPVIATIPHQYGSRTVVNPAIDEYNRRIRSIGGSEGVPVANVAGPFNNPNLVQADGLHPSDAGTQAIATAFANKVP